MTYPGIIFWIFFLFAAVADQRTLLTCFFGSFAFGSLSVVPPELTAGWVFLPRTVLALLLIFKYVALPIIASSQRLVRLTRGDNLGFLLAFLAISFVVTIFMPRLFEGTVNIIPLRVLVFAASEPLAPSPGNFSQSIYLSVSVMVTFAAAYMANSPQFAGHLLFGVLVGGAILVGSGVADMMATAAGQSALLDPFRNATYAMLTNADVGGVRRVVGLMPEASAFGSCCVWFGAALLFLRPLYPAGLPRLMATATALSLVGMALLSTSSSAYAGLFMLGVLVIANLGRRLVAGSAVSRSGVVFELLGLFVSLIAILVVLAVEPEVFDPLVNLVNEIIFNKAMTASYYERSFWSQTSWNAFLSTYGMGVGLGSTRASNYFVALISNTGVFASACFFIFLLKVLLRRSNGSPQYGELNWALKLTIIPALGMAALGAATPDFDPWLGVIFGSVIGLSMQANPAAQADSIALSENRPMRQIVPESTFS